MLYFIVWGVDKYLMGGCRVERLTSWRVNKKLNQQVYVLTWLLTYLVLTCVL